MKSNRETPRGSIIITRAPAHATIQDTGRRGFLANGVPRSGAMDVPALITLNALLGNALTAAAIEWALSAGEITFGISLHFAIGGSGADASLNNRPIESYREYAAAEGDTLTIAPSAGGRFIYVAVSGGIDCDIVMNSRSTYVPGGFGGLDGRRLASGDALSVGQMRDLRVPHRDRLPGRLHPPLLLDAIRFIADTSTPSVSLQGRYTVSTASDRIGYRLESTMDERGASVTSAPVCPGVIQLPPSGEPVVLMADAPTIGGYLIAGCVISADLGVLAQHPPGAAIELTETNLYEARRAALLSAERVSDVQKWRAA